MERLTLDLSQPKTWRIPWETAAIVVVDSDGDLSQVYVKLGNNPRRQWNLAGVDTVQGPPSLEWHIVNKVAQPGKVLEIIAVDPREINLIPTLKTQAVKAHSLKTDIITVGTEVVRGPNVKAAPDRAILIVADSGNTGNVYVGDSPEVTINTGFPLSAGMILALNIDNLDDCYFIADSEDQKLRYIVEVTG